MEPLLLDITFPLSQSESFFQRSTNRTNSGNSHHKIPDWTHSFPLDLFGTDVVPTSAKQHQTSNTQHSLSEFDSDIEEVNYVRSPPVTPSATSSSTLCSSSPSSISTPFPQKMESFSPEKVTDFKHVIYNLLVENYNNPDPNHVPFVQPCTVELDGTLKMGFRFNENSLGKHHYITTVTNSMLEHPDKKLPELYAYHIRKARLDLEDQSSIFIQDLYKFYLRACLELLGKYFQKIDKYTFLYDDDTPLFVPGTSLKQAEERMRKMRTRARKRKSSENSKSKRKVIKYEH
jgi:hypothetical protein